MKVSVVCPYFNERLILARAIPGMLEQLEHSALDWELILVNDGSTDESYSIARNCVRGEPRARLVTYEKNQGRGYALWRGIQEAVGDIVITTEVDLSWGDTIVSDIADRFGKDALLDAVIASPNLRGGGYRNVPASRVWISRMGNRLLRVLFSRRITMYTGMTRGYRRELIQSFACDERGKEFHLDVVFKLILLKCNLEEVPAVLEWKDAKLTEEKGARRKSSSKILRLISTHLNFAAFANPIRYFWAFSALSGLLGFLLAVAALVGTYSTQVKIYLAILSVLLAIFALLLLGFGVISSQNNRILRELWRTQMMHRGGGRSAPLRDQEKLS